MRVAVSFSGLPRAFPVALVCWERLITRYQADVYMHLWNHETGNISSILEMFKPVSCSIESLREFSDIDHYRERAVSSDPYSVFSMWTSINESMALIEKSGRIYDRVVRARLDVAFDNIEFLDSHGVVIPGKPAEIYVFNGHRYPGWHDMMAYGDQQSMISYANTLQEIPKIYSEGSPFFSEFFLSTHLFRRKINTTHHGVFADIVRA